MEKISDYIEDIVNINIKNTKINYRPQTYQQLKKIYKKINSLFKNIIESLYNSKKINIKSSYSTIANFKIIENEFRDNLINNNLSKNENKELAALFDLLFAFNKIVSHLKNIAQTIERDYQWSEDKNSR